MWHLFCSLCSCPVTVTVTVNTSQQRVETVQMIVTFFPPCIYVKAHQHKPDKTLDFWVIPLFPSLNKKKQMQLQTGANIKLGMTSMCLH